MPNAKISELSAANGLDGTEVLALVQSAETRKATINQVSAAAAEYIAGTGSQAKRALNLEFERVATVEYDTLLPASLILFEEDFDADTGQFTSYTEGTGATQSISGGQLTITNSAGAARSDLLKEGDDLTIPQVFCQIDVVSRTGTPSSYDNVAVGIVKDASNFVLALVDRVGNQVHIQVKIGGSSSFQGTVSRTLGNGPYKLGFSLIANSACAYVDTGNGWEFVTGHVISTGTINFKSTSLTGWRPGFAVISSGSGGTTTCVLDNFKAGRFGGVGIRDIHIVSEEDGTPYIVGSDAYITATLTDGMGLVSTTTTAYQAVLRIDLDTYALEQTAVILVERSGVKQPDCAGQIIYYANGDRRLIVSTWGDPANGALEIHQGLLTGLEILAGTHLVTGLVKLNLPLQGVSDAVYDPSLVKDGATWRIAYTWRENSNFTYKCAAASSADLSTWVHDGDDNAKRNVEGTKFLKFGDEYFVAACDFTTLRLYDKKCNFRGILGATVDGGFPNVTNPHPMIFLNGDKYVLLTFDGEKAFPGVTRDFTWGRMIVHEATA